MLDPQARALLDLMVERQIPPTHTLAPDQARAAYRERRFFTQPDPPPLAEVADLRTDGGLPLRLYRPTARDATGPDGPRLPLLVYFHGGGWVIGDLETHDVVCRTLAAGSGWAVLAVDYRMGPEHRFPAAVDDAVAAFRWARRQAPALGVDPACMAVGGDSAGGNLAAVTCLALRRAGEVQPVLQLLVYPAADMRLTTASHRANAQGYLLTADSLAWYQGHYLPAETAAREAALDDWRASPLRAADAVSRASAGPDGVEGRVGLAGLAGLAPALVLTAGFDPLRDEGRAYADALSAAGVPTQYVCFERQIHGFLTMGRVIDEAHSALALCAHVLRQAGDAPAPPAPG